MSGAVQCDGPSCQACMLRLPALWSAFPIYRAGNFCDPRGTGFLKTKAAAPLVHHSGASKNGSGSKNGCGDSDSDGRAFPDDVIEEVGTSTAAGSALPAERRGWVGASALTRCACQWHDAGPDLLSGSPKGWHRAPILDRRHSAVRSRAAPAVSYPDQQTPLLSALLEITKQCLLMTHTDACLHPDLIPHYRTGFS